MTRRSGYIAGESDFCRFLKTVMSKGIHNSWHSDATRSFMNTLNSDSSVEKSRGLMNNPLEVYGGLT